MAAAELDMVVDNVKANNAVTTSHAKASVESAKAANSTGSEVLKFLTVVSAAALLGVKVYKHK